MLAAPPFDPATATDEAVFLEVKRLCTLLDVQLMDSPMYSYDDPGYYLYWVESIWGGGHPSKRLMVFTKIDTPHFFVDADGKLRPFYYGKSPDIRFHYWRMRHCLLRDFIYYRLGLGWDEGQLAYPLIQADGNASCLWAALEVNPHDDAPRNALLDWLTECAL